VKRLLRGVSPSIASFAIRISGGAIDYKDIGVDRVKWPSKAPDGLRLYFGISSNNPTRKSRPRSLKRLKMWFVRDKLVLGAIEAKLRRDEPQLE
jgi:hypothetical protein